MGCPIKAVFDLASCLYFIVIRSLKISFRISANSRIFEGFLKDLYLQGSSADLRRSSKILKDPVRFFSMEESDLFVHTLRPRSRILRSMTKSVY